jgi:hypothetical protein
VTSEPPPGDREAFRAWVRTHHPDAGGDPAQFAAGLKRWQSGRARPAPQATVTAFRSRHGLWRITRWWGKLRRQWKVNSNGRQK